MEKQLVSEKDAAIANLISSQGDFPDITVVNKQQNLFDLPKDCVPVYGKYDFRWVSKDTRMIERNLIKGWRICNRILCPFLQEHNFSTNGAVEKYGHILAFRPKDLGEAYRRKYQDASNDQIKAATKAEEKDKDGSPFYTAKLSKSEEDSAGSSEMIQDRDF